MPTTTSYDFGDVLLVPFRFTDLTTSKKRPAVVVSSATYHRDRSDIIVATVTTQARARPTPSEVPFVEWKAAGLIKPSIVKPVLATLDPSLVMRKLGRLGAQDQQALREALRTLLG